MIPPSYDSTDPHKQYRFSGDSVVDPTSSPLTITNTPLVYDFKFTKLNNKSNPLANAEFTVTKVVADGSGGYIPVSPTETRVEISQNNTGLVLFQALSVGIYKIEETLTPSGYISNSGLSDIFEIKLDTSDNTLAPVFIGERHLIQGASEQNYTVVNSMDSLFKFTLYGFTRDNTGTIVDAISTTNKVAPLSGAQFKLTRSDDPNVFYTAVSDGRGLVSFNDATTNVEYIFQQISTPTTHLKSNTVYRVKFVDSGGGITADVRKENPSSPDLVFNQSAGQLDYVAVNEKNDIVVKVKKVGDAGEGKQIIDMPGLQGAIYEIYEYDLTTNKTVGDSIQITSDATGMMEFRNFAIPGKSYILYENLAPPNYFTDSKDKFYGVVSIGLDKSISFNMDKSAANNVPVQDYWYFDGTNSILYVKNVERFPELTLLVGDDKTNANGKFGNSLIGAKFRLTMLVKNEVGDLVPTTDSNHIFNAESNSEGKVIIPFNKYLPPHQAGGDPYDPQYVYYRLDEI